MFAKNRKVKADVTPIGQASRKGDVTCADLDAAVGAVCAETGTDGEVYETFHSLGSLTNDLAEDDIVKIEGRPPVSLAQFDEALAAVPDMPKSNLSTFTKLRPLLAEAEKKIAQVDNAPVGRAEFDALVGIVGAVLAAADAAQSHTSLPECRFGHQFQRIKSGAMSATERNVVDQVNRAVEVANEALRLAERRLQNDRRKKSHY